MLSLLIPIAIHSRDIRTTKNLLSTCKSEFQDVDIWKLKYDYDFSHLKFLECWSAYENYIVQKINNFALLYRGSDDKIIDNLLYEYNPIYERLFSFVDGAIDDGKGASNGSFIRFNIKDRMVIFGRAYYGDYQVMGYCGILDGAQIATELEQFRDLNPNTYREYILVDLAGTTPFLIGDKYIKEKLLPRRDTHPWYKFIFLKSSN
jgi:hypothetical protein